MRQPPDSDAPVKAALDDAKRRIAAGDVDGALAVYRAAWDDVSARGDHHHGSVVAHMAGVAEPDPAKKHQWNLDALREADTTGDRARIAGFYSSLYGNLALQRSASKRGAACP